jgi:hypothetical protein
VELLFDGSVTINGTGVGIFDLFTRYEVCLLYALQDNIPAAKNVL